MMISSVCDSQKKTTTLSVICLRLKKRETLNLEQRLTAKECHSKLSPKMVDFSGYQDRRHKACEKHT